MRLEPAAAPDTPRLTTHPSGFVSCLPRRAVSRPPACSRHSTQSIILLLFLGCTQPTTPKDPAHTVSSIRQATQDRLPQPYTATAQHNATGRGCPQQLRKGTCHVATILRDVDANHSSTVPVGPLFSSFTGGFRLVEVPRTWTRQAAER